MQHPNFSKSSWSCALAFPMLSVLSLNLLTSSQIQAQNFGQAQGNNKLPVAPTLHYHSLDQEYRAIDKVIPFEKIGSEWPRQFSNSEKMVNFESLNLPEGVKGRFLYNRGFWDEKATPPRLLGLLIFHQTESKDNLPFGARSIYRFSTSDSDRVLLIFRSPIFSPNGAKSVLLNGFSNPERFNNFGVYIWDFSKKQVLDAISKESVNKDTQPTFYQRVLWSPGSRFLSYLRGGNALGDYDKWTKPYELHVCDTRTNIERLIATDAGHYWSWTHNGTLLFSYLKPQNAYEVAFRRARPSIYEADTKGTKPVKLFDGGYFAQQSPDGDWIAFCDWPGVLTDTPDATKGIKDNQERGIFLFHRPTKKRVFVGKLRLQVGQPPLLQWMPNGKSLFVLESAETSERTLTGTMWKMEIEQQTLNKFVDISISGGEGTPLAGKPGYFTLRGTSPDNRYLYVETVVVTDVYKASVPNTASTPNTQRTLIAVDTETGKQTPMARLTTHIGYDDDWDWHDDSGINPVFAAAEKTEAKLPPISAPRK